MNKRIIVSDVGGTNGRFAVAEFTDKSYIPKITSVQILSCQDFSSFKDMLRTYLISLDGSIPKTAQLSIAGEMSKRQGYLWHYNWYITAEELETEFNFDNVILLNDYNALAHAIPYLTENDFLPITKFDKGQKDAPFSVIGSGSGLGGAIGYYQQDHFQVISTEPGHMSFSPKNDIELDLFKYLTKTISHISIETLLSGPGLIRIYSFLKSRENRNNLMLTPTEITTKAIDGTDQICVKAVQLFLSILGSTVGDIALSQGSKGGIYLGGGIIPKLSPLFENSDFLERFSDKGPMQSYVMEIPIKIITSEMPALLGAAMAYTNLK